VITKLSTTQKPKLIEKYNRYKQGLKNVPSLESFSDSFEVIRNILDYSHESCYLLETLDEVEQEFLMQLYGISQYSTLDISEAVAYYGVTEQELLSYVHYLLHKLYPDSFHYPEHFQQFFLLIFRETINKDFIRLRYGSPDNEV
jgi:helix-turn-helix protein